jgi:hypothetical protein
MKNLCTMLALCPLLISCGGGSGESQDAAGQTASGKFSGTVAGNTYQVAVSCDYFDQDYFQFKSDRTDASDSNGDGIVISGMQNNGKFVLTIMDSGTTFSTGNLSNFEKGDNKATGSGTLFEDGGTDTAEVQFSIDCG